MAQNVFDQACRYLAKLDPLEFLRWLLGLPAGSMIFRTWLDTRRIPFPGERDRYCDTVAHLEDVQRGQLPWALILEFQLEPDALMFGRLFAYGGQVWLEIKPSMERGDRFHFGALIVNLTGKGDAARTMEWPEAGLFTGLRPCERNLSGYEAKTVLDAIAAGRVGRVVLPFIPLMQGGCESGIIQQWLTVASTEPDLRRRSDYGGLVEVFAEAVDCAEAWNQALKGWPMIESKVVSRWRNEGRIEGLLEALLRVLRRFGSLPADLETTLQAQTTPETLENWLDLAVRATSLDEFRQSTSL